MKTPAKKKPPKRGMRLRLADAVEQRDQLMDMVIVLLMRHSPEGTTIALEEVVGTSGYSLATVPAKDGKSYDLTLTSMGQPKVTIQ